MCGIEEGQGAGGDGRNPVGVGPWETMGGDSLTQGSANPGLSYTSPLGLRIQPKRTAVLRSPLLT